LSCTFLACVCPVSSPSGLYVPPSDPLLVPTSTSSPHVVALQRDEPIPSFETFSHHLLGQKSFLLATRVALFFLSLQENPHHGFVGWLSLTPRPYSRHFLPSPSPSATPTPSKPEPGHLHLVDSLLLMMFLLGHAVDIRRCSFLRHADDSHLPKGRFVLVGRSHSFPLVGRSLSRPSPIPCNAVTGCHYIICLGAQETKKTHE
jgi:hypothetical protein